MITLENVSFSYNRRKQVFRQIDLRLEPGRIYGLLGKNAAGKSTLLRLMCGLLFPTGGRCEVNDLISLCDADGAGAEFPGVIDEALEHHSVGSKQVFRGRWIP